MRYQQLALRVGSIFVGLLLLYGAYDQLRTGRTMGLSGKGQVLRDQEPGYFNMMLVGRLILGPALLLLGLLL